MMLDVEGYHDGRVGDLEADVHHDNARFRSASGMESRDRVQYWKAR